jgi:hypothetical protein
LYKNESFSDFFKKYFEDKQNDKVFVESLVNKIKTFSESFIDLFLKEILKLTLFDNFYKLFYLFIKNEEAFKYEESKEKIITFFRKKSDLQDLENIQIPQEESKEQILDEDIEEKINSILNKKWILLDEYILLFQYYNDIDFLLKRYNQQNVTTIRKNKNYDNETKIKYFETFREAFIRNFNEFEDSNEIVKFIRKLEINLQKL